MAPRHFLLGPRTMDLIFCSVKFPSPSTPRFLQLTMFQKSSCSKSDHSWFRFMLCLWPSLKQCTGLDIQMWIIDTTFHHFDQLLDRSNSRSRFPPVPSSVWGEAHRFRCGQELVWHDCPQLRGHHRDYGTWTGECQVPWHQKIPNSLRSYLLPLLPTLFALIFFRSLVALYQSSWRKTRGNTHAPCGQMIFFSSWE